MHLQMDFTSFFGIFLCEMSGISIKPKSYALVLWLTVTKLFKLRLVRMMMFVEVFSLSFKKIVIFIGKDTEYFLVYYDI